jgi:hypothetical protein
MAALRDFRRAFIFRQYLSPYFRMTPTILWHPMTKSTQALPSEHTSDPAGALVVEFPTTYARQSRLHARAVAVDAAPFWELLRAGHVVEIQTGYLPADSLWVRDNATWVQAFAKWHDLPIRIVGELFIVPDAAESAASQS